MGSHRRSLVVTSFLVLLAAAAAPLHAQHAQGHAQPGSSREAEPADPANTLGTLLRATDEAVGAIEVAVGDADQRLAARWAEAYVEAAEALADYTAGAELARIARDLSRAGAALERQAKRLRELNARAPRELRAAVGAAHDAARRAGDSVRAAREESPSAGTGSGHHQGVRRSGCGRY